MRRMRAPESGKSMTTSSYPDGRGSFMRRVKEGIAMDRVEHIAEVIAQQEKTITRKALFKSAVAAGIGVAALTAALEARGVEAAVTDVPERVDAKTIRVQGIYTPGTIPGGVGKKIHKMADVA